MNTFLIYFLFVFFFVLPCSLPSLFMVIFVFFAFLTIFALVSITHSIFITILTSVFVYHNFMITSITSPLVFFQPIHLPFWKINNIFFLKINFSIKKETLSRSFLYHLFKISKMNNLDVFPKKLIPLVCVSMLIYDSLYSRLCQSFRTLFTRFMRNINCCSH